MSRAKNKPDPEHVEQLNELVEARLEEAEPSAPEGAEASPADFLKHIGKLIPKLSPLALEIAISGADGQLSPDEVNAVAGKLVEFVQSLRATSQQQQQQAAPDAGQQQQPPGQQQGQQQQPQQAQQPQQQPQQQQPQAGSQSQPPA
jgi:hypothetical protein